MISLISYIILPRFFLANSAAIELFAVEVRTRGFPFTSRNSTPFENGSSEPLD